MLESKYYKDLSHNYLILKSSRPIGKNKYQNKMLTGNRIKNILPCNIRNLNDEEFFYYEISSKQSMESLCEREGITYKQLFFLFESINEASKAAKEYLLQDNYILLVPKYIYANPEGEEYYFVYYPYAEETDIGLPALADFLLENIDKEDKKAVEIVYRIYELIQDEQFILKGILSLFDETAARQRETQRYTAYNGSASEEAAFSDAIPSKDTLSDAVPASDIPLGAVEKRAESTGQEAAIGYGNTDDGELWEEYGYGQEEQKERSEGMIISAVFFFLCIAAIMGIFCIRYFLVLSPEEELLTMAGIIILTLAASFLCLYLITFPVRRRLKRRQKAAAAEDIMDRKGTEPVDSYVTEQAKSQKHQEHHTYAGCMEGGRQEEVEYGNTVFLEASLIERENKLYGISKGNKYHIDLDKIPCTVGKMAGSVDIAIKDNSISRLHARFSKKGEEICVTDLNSTNGTFKNGLRLEPNETIAIEPGDEIRFGKMTFCYR